MVRACASPKPRNTRPALVAQAHQVAPRCDRARWCDFAGHAQKMIEKTGENIGKNVGKNIGKNSVLNRRLTVVFVELQSLDTAN